MTIPPTPSKLRIIYAEDSPTEREMLVRLLTNRGHYIACFNDGKPALQAIVSASYDVLITDNDMPHMTGLELVRELRRIKSPIKIIVTSGYLELEMEEQYRELGVRVFLPKPSPDEKVFRAVEG